MAKRLGVKVADLPANKELLDKIDVKELASQGVGGLETMADIIAELRKPGRDPRTEENIDAFVPGVESFEQIAVGQTLPGMVNNITAFGAFVDLGIKENGLLHISKISRRRINDVSDILHLGQRLDVKVIDIDTARRRISLSLID